METISKYELRKEIIDEEVREAIYKEATNIKCFSHENYGFRFSDVSKKIRNDEMLGWCYQLCFVLAPFYEKCILNRGVLNKLNPPYKHCWLDIYMNGDWYTFDPCFNICCRKETYANSYGTEVYVSFTGDEIKQLFLSNVTKSFPFGIRKGNIRRTSNIKDIGYGNSIRYTLVTDKAKIKSMRIKYL